MIIKPSGTNISIVCCDLEPVTPWVAVATVARISGVGGTNDVGGAIPNAPGVVMTAANVNISPGSDVVLDTVAIEPKVQTPSTMKIGPPGTNIAPWIVNTHKKAITAMSAVVVGAVC